MLTELTLAGDVAAVVVVVAAAAAAAAVAIAIAVARFAHTQLVSRKITSCRAKCHAHNVALCCVANLLIELPLLLLLLQCGARQHC